MRATIAVLVLCAAGCRGDTPGTDETAASPAVDSAVAGLIGDTVEDTVAPGAPPAAQATLRDSTGQELGTLRLTEAAGGINVSGRLSGLPPGTHGIHVHAVGRCDPPFESAGPHWNPTNRN